MRKGSIVNKPLLKAIATPESLLATIVNTHWTSYKGKAT